MMFDWTRMKYYLNQKMSVAMNLPAYAQDINEFAGVKFKHPARGFRCNTEGIYAIYYAGMEDMAVPYALEFCAAGMDYVGSIVNVKTGDAVPVTVAVETIIMKW